MAGKSKYWTAMMYPENMIDDWENEIASKLQIPFAYCIHDKDLEKDGKTTRKTHVHIMVVFSNTTTQNHALTVFKTLEKNGCSAIPNDVIQQVYGVRHTYDYLIHDTEDSKKKGKHLYDKKERVTGNLFDIGAYEQVSTAEKLEMKKELMRLIKKEQIFNYYDFLEYVMENMTDEYVDIAFTFSGAFERLTKGYFLKMHGSSYTKIE